MTNLMRSELPKGREWIEVPARLRTVVTRLFRRLQRTEAASGFTPSQLVVLGTTARRGPLRLSKLAELEGINPTMLSRVVQRLEADGLLLRRSDPEDGRAATVEVSAAGRRLFERMRRERTGALAELIDELTIKERAALSAALPVLEHLADGLRDSTRGHRP